MWTRLAAWWTTGPLGHLAAGVADWAQLLARHVSRSKRPPRRHH